MLYTQSDTARPARSTESAFIQQHTDTRRGEREREREGEREGERELERVGAKHPSTIQNTSSPTAKAKQKGGV
ncbi:hypothetical protein AOLI_G00319530 [Acnodon oligacanthus]